MISKFNYNGYPRRALAGLVLIVGVALALPAAGADLTPFDLPWHDGSASVTNVSRLLDAPAGHDGFITVEDGHFVDGNGERIRFLGVNNSFDGNFPAKEDAAQIAARLAKFGVNCVRFHHMDTLRAPNGIWEAGTFDKQALDAEQLDRMDYFVHQLKNQGIYININLKVGRKTVEADGIEQADLFPTYDKGPDHYHPRLIELQKDYARDLLTHENPYTGNRYVDEPALAMVEIVNESGLVREWYRGMLDDLPEQHTQPLEALWNQFLQEKYDSTAALRTAWQPEHQADEREMMPNGVDGWNLQVLEQAQANIGRDQSGPEESEAAHIEITGTGEQSWHVQAIYPDLSLEAGRLYRFSVWLRANPPREVEIGPRMNHDPWQMLDTTAVIDAGREWQRHEIYFTSGQDEPDARLDFTNLGGETGSLWFAQPSLVETSPSGLPQGQSLEDETIAWLPRQRYASRSEQAREDWVRFLIGQERAYHQEMHTYLREELGVKVPITGSQFNFAIMSSQLVHDYIDNHAYWQHPSFPGQAWDSQNWVVNNVSIVNEIDSALQRMMRNRVEGMPYTVSEYNHPAPNTYSTECIPLLAAYAAFQDWDGIFYYSYSHDANHRGKDIDSFFDIVGHAPKMMAMPVAANLFLRGDLTVSPQAVIADLPVDEYNQAVVDANGGIWHDPLSLAGLPTETPYQYRTAIRMQDSGNPVDNPPIDDEAFELRSDTEELAWRQRGTSSYVRIMAQDTKGLIGFDPRRPVALGDGVELEVGETQQRWANVLLSKMHTDDEGEHWLLVATGYHENQGMQWNDNKTSVGNQWGEGPPLIEPVPMQLRLANQNAKLQLFTLDEQGKRQEEISSLIEASDDQVEIDLSEAPGLWYELLVVHTQVGQSGLLHEEEGSPSSRSKQ